jgi:hypothetical protein|nr:MAG TPA_asm: hypothetical protein [Caudoviricetes sp.]
MSKHTKGNGTNDTSAVFVVTTDNMGDRLDFDDTAGKYNVNVEDILKELTALKKSVKTLSDNQSVNTAPSIDKPTAYFDLDRDLTGLGMKVFFGNIIVNTNGGTHDIIQQGTGVHLPDPCIVKGFPIKPINQTTNGEKVDAGYKESDFVGKQDYDFSGYQFATPVEIVQVVFHGSRMSVRTNDAGMSLNGEILNPNVWGKWISV